LRQEDLALASFKYKLWSIGVFEVKNSAKGCEKESSEEKSRKEKMSLKQVLLTPHFSL